MHIPDGVLSAEIAAGGFALSAIATAIALKKMKRADAVKTAVFGSAYFLISIIHIPLGPGDVHLSLLGFMGLALGWRIFPSVFSALLLHYVIFNFGGIGSFGVNLFANGFAGLVCFYALKGALKTKKIPVFWTGFTAGLAGAAVSALIIYCAIVFSSAEYISAGKVFLFANIPVLFLEALITAFLLKFVVKIKPEIMGDV